MDVPLPNLTETPTRHPDCCLSISTKLIDVLTEVLTSAPRDKSSDEGSATATTVLSIGSGTGLLEALLLAAVQRTAPQHHQGSAAPLSIEGVEVSQADTTASVNRYLPEQAISTVRGTWHVSPRVRDDDVRTLLFVYPRLPALVLQYVGLVVSAAVAGAAEGGESSSSSKCDRIVWLGPRADWPDFEPCFWVVGDRPGGGAGKFGVARVLEGADAGLVEYEIMVVLEVQQ